jgi:catechol 2,3-dioxygenase-like lactoylglutathione lyase family enzyme
MAGGRDRPPVCVFRRTDKRKAATMQPHAVLETCLYVDDLDAAEEFYTDILGLPVHFRDDVRQVFLRCGEGMLLLFRAEETEKPGKPVNGAAIPTHGARGPGHAALRVAPDSRDAWREHLRDHDVAIESEVEWPGGGWSLYMRDPAGNSLELATGALWGLDG